MVAWFFVQVWALCLVAFLLGAAVTWLVFVRPLRRAARPAAAEGWAELQAWPVARPAAAPPAPAAPQPDPGPVTDPALSALDATGRRAVAGPGFVATEALDQLGVTLPVPEQQPAGRPDRGPEIPAQSGPPDAAGR